VEIYFANFGTEGTWGEPSAPARRASTTSGWSSLGPTAELGSKQHRSWPREVIYFLDIFMDREVMKFLCDVEGAKLVLACRDQASGEEARKAIRKVAQNAVLVVEKLDLCSFESIKQFVKNLGKRQ
jgi:hypothetical protein